MIIWGNSAHAEPSNASASLQPLDFKSLDGTLLLVHWLQLHPLSPSPALSPYPPIPLSPHCRPSPTPLLLSPRWWAPTACRMPQLLTYYANGKSGLDNRGGPNVCDMAQAAIEAVNADPSISTSDLALCDNDGNGIWVSTCFTHHSSDTRCSMVDKILPRCIRSCLAG